LVILNILGTAGFAAYTASKFVVRGLTQVAGMYGIYSTLLTLTNPVLALEFGSHGITVNAYGPGPIDTDMCRFDPSIVFKPLSIFTVQDFDASTAKGTGMAPGALTEGVSCQTVIYLVNKYAAFLQAKQATAVKRLG
jgi:NAD(P)-dependent dehydrogenase (short-subunit alcohol dehydrogenase family)